MGEEPQYSGWLPPKAPAHPTSPQAPPRPTGEWPRPPQQREPSVPSSPHAVAATGVSSAAILLLVATVGVSYAISLVLALFGYLLARQAKRRPDVRPGQIRAAVLTSAVAIGLAGFAALVWAILAANGITPSDFADWAREELDRMRAR
jgi:hypothetical protein